MAASRPAQRGVLSEAAPSASIVSRLGTVFRWPVPSSRTEKAGNPLFFDVFCMSGFTPYDQKMMIMIIGVGLTMIRKKERKTR